MLILPAAVSGSVRDAVALPGNPQTLFAAAENGLYVSRDAGETWRGRSLGRPTPRAMPPR